MGPEGLNSELASGPQGDRLAAVVIRFLRSASTPDLRWLTTGVLLAAPSSAAAM